MNLSDVYNLGNYISLLPEMTIQPPSNLRTAVTELASMLRGSKDFTSALSSSVDVLTYEIDWPNRIPMY